MKSQMLQGLGVSEGVGIGRALVVIYDLPPIGSSSDRTPDLEIKKLESALQAATSQVEVMHERAKKTVGPEKAQIFEAHLMMLSDPEVKDQTLQLIQSTKCSAEFAYKKIVDQFADKLSKMKNAYMRERAQDLRDISDRVIRNLMGLSSVDLSNLTDDVVLIAKDLKPSDTVMMDKTHVRGFITEVGGKTSHTAILARTLGLPAVMGVTDALNLIHNKDNVGLNGKNGQVFLNPDSTLSAELEIARQDFLREKQELQKQKGLTTITKSGVKITLGANIGSVEDLNVAIENDAEGVGLFRTEFLFLDRATLPTEDEQYQVYSQILKKMPKHPVIIRTLDVGGDKELPALGLKKEENPFLGLRAVRLCLKNPTLFETQLRALLRASVFGHLGIMVPMISNLDEILEVKKIIEKVKTELKSKSIPVSDQIEFGIMIEIPSAAIMSDVLADHVDFFSIGTNDLIQYTMAVDRMNKDVQYLYSPHQPAVLRLVDMVAKNAKAKGKWVGMCGEAASDLSLVEFWVKCGLTELSVSPTQVLRVRKLIRSLD